MQALSRRNFGIGLKELWEVKPELTCRLSSDH
jgi:hypothetical protein